MARLRNALAELLFDLGSLLQELVERVDCLSLRLLAPDRREDASPIEPKE